MATLNPRHRPSSQARVNLVIHALIDMCDALSPGDRLPTHLEIVRQLNMPERAVLAALKEMHRTGRVQRIHGSGTYVADPTAADDRSARAVASSRLTGSTVVALARPDSSFHDRSIEQLSGHLASASLDLIVRPVPADRDLTKLADEVELAAGYIVFGYQLAPIARALLERGERVVSMGTPSADTYVDVPTIYSDQEVGGYFVAQHLLNLGHRNIAFAHTNPDSLRQTMRWSGHMRAIVEAQRGGSKVNASILDGEQLAKLETDPSSTREYIAAGDAPTAIAAWNDIDALRLIAVLSRAGISVPGLVSVAGYDATQHGAVMHPSLTSVDNALEAQLRAAVALLTRPIPPPRTYTIVMQPVLIVRESTGQVSAHTSDLPV